MKYVLVSGGVISGIGKGIIASSVGVITKAGGLRTTHIKIDPYLNLDAGTFSPFEHGETFVLDDGGEVDLDLGNYERFLDVTLHRDNNITTGKIYSEVIERERRGDYLGKTVQVVPHITDSIQNWIERVAKVSVDGSDLEPEVCVIELGGTIGDIESMPFVEALRQFQFRVGRENFLQIHVSLVPQMSTTGEQKTKPTQHSIRELRGLGLSPDIIVCRSRLPLNDSVKDKVGMFCHVAREQVITVHDLSSIYHVPLLLEKQNLSGYFEKRLQVKLVHPETGSLLSKWKVLADRNDRLFDPVSIVVVGKYTEFSDAYLSVIKALQHASLWANRKLNITWVEAGDLEESRRTADATKYFEAWQSLSGANGVLVPGGFGERGVEGMVVAAKWAREKGIPYFGICLGLQTAVIEFARTKLGWEDANSTEFNKETTHPVVVFMPEGSKTHMGGTMRLGRRETLFAGETSITQQLYSKVLGDGKPCTHVYERHRHRYEVNPELVAALEDKGMRFVGRDVNGERMEVMELGDHPFYVAVQFHPELKTRPLRPTPLFTGFILAACNKLEAFLKGQLLQDDLNPVEQDLVRQMEALGE